MPPSRITKRPGRSRESSSARGPLASATARSLSPRALGFDDGCVAELPANDDAKERRSKIVSASPSSIANRRTSVTLSLCETTSSRVVSACLCGGVQRCSHKCVSPLLFGLTIEDEKLEPGTSPVVVGVTHRRLLLLGRLGRWSEVCRKRSVPKPDAVSVE